MTFDLSSLFPDFEALTPDGRWNALQDWLKQNPEYGDRIEAWSKLNVDQVFAEIRDLIAERFGVSSRLVSLLAIGKEQTIKNTISTLQTLYRERAGIQTEKEIKHVGPVKRRNGRKNPKRISRHRG